MSDGGMSPGTGAGHAGTSAPEVPPLVRTPSQPPAPDLGDDLSVSDPLPFERPARRDAGTSVLGPTGRPMPDFPEPRPRRRARQRPGRGDVQPEGRRRQDDDHHQPGRLAGRVRPQGAAGRLRPAGLAVGRPRAQPARDGPVGLQPADGARRHPRRRRRALRRARHGPAALQHRPLGRRGAAGPRGRPRADPAAGARPGARRSTTSSSSTASPRWACSPSTR